MRKEKGATLLEIVIAIGLISVILMSLVSLSTKSLSNSTVSREKNQATRFTQETIEWVRQERDASWRTLNEKVDQNQIWCMPTNSWSTPGACSDQTIANTSFKREVHFNRTNQESLEVTVVTQWYESGNLNESRSATLLTKWQ